jgi:hypothetical protein
MKQITFTKDEVEFMTAWGQTDAEVADVLDADANDSGFSELAIGSDFIWIDFFERWVRRSNSFYEKEDEEALRSIIEKVRS